MVNHNKLAEFVGVMLGDGYFSYPKCPRIKISFNSISDKEYLYFVHNLLVNLFQSKIKVEHRKNESTSNLFIFNRKTLNYILNDLRLLPSPKWGRATIPDWVFEKNLESHVLKGYFDTDGCVVITNNNGTIYPRLEMKVCPSPMQEQFISSLRKLGFNFGVYNIGKGKVRIQMNGKKELRKWYDLIGFSNPKHYKKYTLFN